MALLARESVCLDVLRRDQSGCAADAVEEKKCTMRPVVGIGGVRYQLNAAETLSASVLRQSPLRKKKALLALALRVFAGARLIPVKCFVVTLLGLRGAGPLVQQVPRRRGCLISCC